MNQSAIDQVLALKKIEDSTAYCVKVNLQTWKETATPNRTHESKVQNTEVSPNFNVCMTPFWRSEISLWTFRVADYFRIPRETVAISMNYFDRYLAACEQLKGTCTEEDILLASLATFHLAVKVHESKKIRFRTLASLTNRRVNAQQIEEMEYNILTVLSWRLNPSTSESFLHLLLQLISGEHLAKMKVEIYKKAQYFTELCVCDSFFLQYKTSTIAYASILLAIHEVGAHSSCSCQVSMQERDQFTREVFQYTFLSSNTKDMEYAQGRLNTMLQGALASQLMENPNLQKLTGHVSSSNLECDVRSYRRTDAVSPTDVTF